MTTPKHEYLPVRRPRRRHLTDTNPARSGPRPRFVAGQLTRAEGIGPLRITRVVQKPEGGLFGLPFGGKEAIYEGVLLSGAPVAVPESQLRSFHNPSPAPLAAADEATRELRDDDELAYAEGDDEHCEPIDDDLGDEADEDRGEDEAASDMRRTRRANPRGAVYPLRPLDDDEGDDEGDDEDDEDDDLDEVVVREAARSAAEFDAARWLPMLAVGGLVLWALTARPRPSA